jgi:SAM-dependent methyltransferase
MKKIPDLPNVDIEPLFAITQGVEKYYLLKTAMEIGLFNFCDKPRSEEDVIGRFHTDPQLTTKFLKSLVSIGFLEVKEAMYGNSTLTQAYLVKEMPFYQGNLLRLIDRNSKERWGNLLECLTNGDRQQDKNKAPIFNADFTVAMAEGAMRGGLHKTVEIVSNLPEFNQAKRLLDLGGGHGLYSIAFCQGNPNLTAVIMDIPPVLEVTNKYVQEYGMTDKIHLIPGDFLVQPLEKGFDIVFCSDSLYRPREKLVPLLKKIHDSLSHGGLFISKHWLLNKEGYSPETTVLFDLTIAINGRFPMQVYTIEEAVELYESQGFITEIHDISTPSKPSWIIICRKENSHDN